MVDGLFAFPTEESKMNVVINKMMSSINWLNIAVMTKKLKENDSGAEVVRLRFQRANRQRGKSQSAWQSRGYLPHFDQPGLVQSMTF